MTKTLEEGVLDLLLEIVKHCYRQYIIPWHEHRKIANQNRTNEQKAAHSIQLSDDNQNGNGNALEEVPLSVQEIADSVHEMAHSLHSIDDNQPIPSHLRFDLDSYLSEYAPNLADKPASVSGDIPNVTAEPERAQPDAAMPPWLRNRVGVHIVEAGGIAGSRPARPVYIDNDNRQVVISQQALATLINLVPWGQLPQDNHAHQALAALAGSSRPQASNQGLRRAPVTSTTRTRTDEQREVEQTDGTQSVPVIVQHNLRLPQTGSQVPTSLQVFSTKCLSQIGRLRFGAEGAKAVSEEEKADRYRELRERLQTLQLAADEHKDEPPEAQPSLLDTSLSSMDTPFATAMSTGPMTGAPIPSVAPVTAVGSAPTQNVLSAFIHRLATAPSAKLPVNEDVLMRINNPAPNTGNEIKLF